MKTDIRAVASGLLAIALALLFVLLWVPYLRGLNQSSPAPALGFAGFLTGLNGYMGAIIASWIGFELPGIAPKMSSLGDRLLPAIQTEWIRNVVGVAYVLIYIGVTILGVDEWRNLQALSPAPPDAVIQLVASEVTIAAGVFFAAANRLVAQK